MKLFAVVLLSLATVASAFPAFQKLTPEQVEHARRMMEERQLLPNPVVPILGGDMKVTVGKKVIPDAAHPFKAPSSTAQRGPCPGLNLMANYGYIDREGIASFSELVYGQQEVMGWGLDLATFLAALAIVVDGNPLTQKVSIGGPDKRVGTIPLLSDGDTMPGGILKHNTYEIDSSLTRDDVAIGNNKDLNTTLWQQMWDTADELNGGVINDKVMTKVRSDRYEASVRDNPQFTFAPIGVLFFFADQFLYNTMPTALDNGEPGPATRETIAPFYGAKRTGERTWEYVPERLPKNWIRRARPLTIPEAVVAGIDTVTTAASKGQLPVGVTKEDLTSPEAVVCAVKSIATGQVPASIAGLQGAASLLASINSIGAAC